MKRPSGEIALRLAPDIAAVIEEVARARGTDVFREVVYVHAPRSLARQSRAAIHAGRPRPSARLRLRRRRNRRALGLRPRRPERFREVDEALREWIACYERGEKVPRTRPPPDAR